jgi:hypothetical protein
MDFCHDDVDNTIDTIDTGDTGDNVDIAEIGADWEGWWHDGHFDIVIAVIDGINIILVFIIAINCG